MVISARTRSILQCFGYLPFENIPPKYDCILKKMPFQRIQTGLTFVAHAIYLLQPSLFLLWVAASTEEIQESTYFVTIAVLYISIYAIFLIRKPAIMYQTKEFQALIEKSKSLNSFFYNIFLCFLKYYTGRRIPAVEMIYKEACRKNDSFAKWFQLFIVDNCIFLYVILPFLITIYNFIAGGFTNKVSANARLGYPAW